MWQDKKASDLSEDKYKFVRNLEEFNDAEEADLEYLWGRCYTVCLKPMLHHYVESPYFTMGLKPFERVLSVLLVSRF